MKILAIETSCDETAAAVIETGGSGVQILSNIISSQIKIHQKFGGVFPEMASRAHAEKIIPVAEEALLKNNGDIDLVAVTTGPGLIGSLLVGVNFAKTYAYTHNLPIIGINHWLGHIYSNWAVINSDLVNNSDSLKDDQSRGEAANHHPSPSITFPSLILIASGGHTGLVLMKSHHEIQTLGETLDDAAGEAFDKVAKLLELGYPGGPSISAAAEKVKSNKLKVISDTEIKFPRAMLDRKDYNFSFSGLKTSVLHKVREISHQSPNHHQSRGEAANHYELSNHYKSLIASEFQQTVCDILIGKTIAAAYEFHPKSICLCGGVSANQELRKQMAEAVKKLPWKTTFHVPPPILSTDNAAMIGVAASYHLDKMTRWDDINANANLRL